MLALWRGQIVAPLAEVDAGIRLAREAGDREALKWISQRESMISEEDAFAAVGVHGIRAHVFLRPGCSTRPASRPTSAAR